MSEKHRKRKNKFQLSLLDEEKELLEKKAFELNMTKTEYIRNLILFGYAGNKRKMDDEQFKKFLYEINRIGNNINQIAYNANAKGSTNQFELLSLTEQFHELLNLFEKFAYDD